MKLLIKNLEEIIDDKVTIVERGILITIMLMKDRDPKITLAKCKTKISFLKNKLELISLHKKGLISWSGYSNAVASLKSKESNPIVVEILDFMNGLYKRGFQPNPTTITSLMNLLKEYTIEDIKMVIANRYVVWKDDATMKQYLVPETIFRLSKFRKYHEEVNHTKVGESFVSAQKIDLKHGQEITQEIAEHFSDNDLYTMITYELDHDGHKITKGREIVKTGLDTKRLLKVRGQQEWKDFMLVYVQR